ncbi:Hypothetical protein A7982_08580 [Minicystis rosea]|nr:Hypothetical protein A7982_08580 [Minicystis rosea]
MTPAGGRGLLSSTLRAGALVMGLAPWLVPLLRAYLPLGAAGVALDAAFATMCHRLPDRSLALAGVTMPLCSRCAGIFTGIAAGALSTWPRLSRRGFKLALTAAGLVMLADVITQDLGLHPVWHATRLATGFVFGHLLGVACLRAADAARAEP